MDDMRPHKNDDVALLIVFLCLAKGKSDDRQAAQAGDARFAARFGIADHAAEHQKSFYQARGHASSCWVSVVPYPDVPAQFIRRTHDVVDPEFL